MKPCKKIGNGKILRYTWKSQWAYVAMRCDKDDHILLESLEVHPKGKGVGEKALKRLRREGFKPLFPIDVEDRAVGFWDKMREKGLVKFLEEDE